MVLTEEFIEVLRTYESIWNIKHPEYKNRKKKAAIWAEISGKVGLSVEDCKKKWKGIRDSYSRENAKTGTSGQEAEEPQERWQYFQQLEFLKENIKPRTTTSNYTAATSKEVPIPMFSAAVEEKENEAEFTSFSEEALMSPLSRSYLQEGLGSTSSQQSSRPKKGRNDSDSIENNLLDTMKSLDVFLNTSVRKDSGCDKEEDTLFCESLVKKLKKFPLNKKNELKVKVLQLLNAEEEQFFS